jgi:hypothetical protein
MAKNRKKLLDKEELFARYYVETMNQTEAAIRAGYAKSGAGAQGSVLARRPRVAERIRELLGEVAVEVDKEYVLDRLRGIIDISMQRQTIMSETGDKTRYIYAPDVALKALDLVSELLLLKGPDGGTGVTVNIGSRLAGMADEELKALENKLGLPEPVDID